MPEDVVGGYKQEGDKYIVTFKTPDIIPVMYLFALLASQCLFH